MPDPLQLNIKDFTYELPREKIAQYPLRERDASKLLVYRNDKISEDVFSNIAAHLDPGSLLVFNETKVVRARLIFITPGNVEIEIFCLEPIQPAEIQTAFMAGETSTWKCLVGNAKRWKTGVLEKKILHDHESRVLTARQIEIFPDATRAIEFSWTPPGCPFSDILARAGQVPLPPYIQRLPEEEDGTRYQTIYARNEGSVAAPTAGLHFTEKVLDTLREKPCAFENVTLHVGLGTFKPVSTSHLGDHLMHHEKIEVSLETLQHIHARLGQPIVAVGTTAARTLESLYWMGCKSLIAENDSYVDLSQWEAYGPLKKAAIPPEKAIHALIQRLEKKGESRLRGNTQMIIAPTYEFKLLSALITNFHMPQSTLLLLVSALIGQNWEKAYAYALKNNFRFLSYGDACLFFKC